MSENIYTRAQVDGVWDLNAKELNAQATAALTGVELVVRATGTQVTVVATPDLTAPQVTTLDGVVSSLQAAFDPLPTLKAAKVQAIRESTAAFIGQGAEWNGRVYMSTAQGRFDVLSIFAVGVTAATAGFFPASVSTTDGTYREEFADAAAFAPFFVVMWGTYKYWKDSGGALRDQVNAATTAAEVAAVTDSRTWPAPI